MDKELNELVKGLERIEEKIDEILNNQEKEENEKL